MKIESDVLLSDPSIALCFDTSAVFGGGKTFELMELSRERLGDGRPLLIPTVVIAERVRQFKVELGSSFDPNKVHRFVGYLRDTLGVEFPCFTEDAAINGWAVVAGNFSSDEWSWENAPLDRLLSKQRSSPCAERCRTADHMIYAIARARGALLVTNDKGLKGQVNHDGYVPGAITVTELQRLLNQDP